MSRRFILDADEASGQFSTFEYDHAEDAYVLRQGQDVSGLIEANKREFNGDHQPHHKADGFGRKVASIPLHIWMELRKQGIVQDRKAFAKWLNDGANAAFRTGPGRI